MGRNQMSTQPSKILSTLDPNDLIDEFLKHANNGNEAELENVRTEIIWRLQRLERLIYRPSKSQPWPP
jgi:hypothetical protein